MISKYKSLITDERSSIAHFGIECGAGWTKILTEMLNALLEINAKQGEGEKISIWQIKEKFGGLRVYGDNLTEEANAIIRAAEDKCIKTCESCGDSANIKSNRGWYRVCCDKCEIK